MLNFPLRSTLYLEIVSKLLSCEDYTGRLLYYKEFKYKSKFIYKFSFLLNLFKHIIK